MNAIEITTTHTVGPYTVATLSDGREIGARVCGDRWTGKMVEISFIDVEGSRWGELVTMRRGTSERLAFAEAIEKLNNPPKKVRAPRRRPVAAAPAPKPPVKQLLGGEGFLWLGTSHRLKVVDDGAPIEFHEPWRHQCWLHLRRDVATADTIIGWYQEQGQPYAAQEVDRWAPRLGLREVQVKVRSLSGKWGQARRNTITLHWAVFQLPRHLIEYIIVHELAHIADTSKGSAHGPAWRQIMDRCLFSEWRERERELAEHDKQCTVWLGDVEDTGAAA